MRVVSQDKNIGEILTSFFFKIPRFQRPYSWTQDNVEDFWTDSVSSHSKDYFIGSMVVYREKGYLGIVDGQQRMTTITIALAAIRDQFKLVNKDDLAKGLQLNIEKMNIENQPEYVLQTETSYPFFQEKVQKFGVPSGRIIEGEEESAIKIAYEKLFSIISNEVIKIRELHTKADEYELAVVNYLRDCRDRILNLKLIFIELDNEDDAYIIFETLNTRGKDLEISDLAKNHFLKLLKKLNAKVDISKDSWRALIKNIESSKFDVTINDFLYHYWHSKYAYVTKKNLFKALKQKITEDNAESELAILINESESYRSIFDHEYKKWGKGEFDIQSSLMGLSIFGVSQPYPVLLAALARYSEKKLRLTDLRKLIHTVENYHFISSAIVGKRSSGSLSTTYSKYGIKLRSLDDNDKVVKLISELKDYLNVSQPSFEEFKANFRNVKFTEKESKQKKLVQYILGKFDKVNRVDPPVKYESMTIEHIVPQHLNTNSVGLIGNLIYVSKELNEKLGTKNAKEKLKILRDANYPLDPYLSKLEDFDEKNILERTDGMAEVAYRQIWK